MQKIMLNERYGLQQATLERIKTCTRRVEKSLSVLPIDTSKYSEVKFKKKKDVFVARVYLNKVLQATHIIKTTYKVGEIVAISQRYKDLKLTGYVIEKGMPVEVKKSKGWQNKMFTKAELMKSHIRITGIGIERMQDISDEDCRREGIVPFTWRQWLKQDFDDCGPQKYKDWDVWTLPKFVESLSDSWGESDPDEFMAESPKVAFYVLIRKLMGKKVWDANPWNVVYYYELLG